MHNIEKFQCKLYDNYCSRCRNLKNDCFLFFDYLLYIYIYIYIYIYSEDSRIVISLRGFLVLACYVVLNQGCCETYQYNLLDRMLQHDFNTTLNQSYVNSQYLVSMTYQSGGSLSPIYPFLGQWSMKMVICPIVFNIFNNF